MSLGKNSFAFRDQPVIQEVQQHIQTSCRCHRRKPWDRLGPDDPPSPTSSTVPAMHLQRLAVNSQWDVPQRRFELHSHQIGYLVTVAKRLRFLHRDRLLLKRFQVAFDIQRFRQLSFPNYLPSMSRWSLNSTHDLQLSHGMTASLRRNPLWISELI